MTKNENEKRNTRDITELTKLSYEITEILKLYAVRFDLIDTKISMLERYVTTLLDTKDLR